MKKITITVLLLTLACCILFSLLTLQELNREEKKPRVTRAPQTVEPVKAAEGRDTEVTYDLPVRLKIPRLKIDAAIEKTGITPEGNMQGPSNSQNAGWYRYGPSPGNEGSAVVTGHYSMSNNEVPVFSTLHTLREGDLVQVIDEQGKIADFTVDMLRTYDKDAPASEVFGAKDRKAHLNLITCKGVWLKNQQMYSDRLVVFAKRK